MLNYRTWGLIWDTKRGREEPLKEIKIRGRGKPLQKYREVRIARKMVEITSPISEGTMQS